MSLDRSDSVERTLEEILAELDLLPSPSAAPETKVSEISIPETEASDIAGSEAAVSSETAAPQPIKEPEGSKPLTVSVSTEQARLAVAEAGIPQAETDGSAAEGPAEDPVNEPSTVVFSPSRLREQIKAAAAASAAPALSAKPAPPSSASLKAELEQRSRSGGGHTVTEQLRAQDPVKFDSMPKKRYQAAGKTVSVKTDLHSAPKEKSRSGLTGWKREAVEWAKALVGAAIVVFILFFVVFRIVNVEGTSMQPTLQPGDRLIVSGLFYTPENGDIVVTSSENNLGKPLVKRIIAMGGQTVDMDEEGRLLINGLVLDEDYLASGSTDIGDLELPMTVPEGTVFLLGDNREVSVDSRSNILGTIPEDELNGRALFRFWPLNRIGAVK